jgi:hypothetical protein
MARFCKNSKLDTAKVLHEAVKFFGSEGMGMQLTEEVNEQAQATAVFKSSGHVFVRASEKEDGSEVELETCLKDHQVEQFLEKI